MSKPVPNSESSKSELQDLPSDWQSWNAERLENELLEHNKHYWDEHNAIISDYDYDRLLERLREVAPKSKVLDELGPQSIGEVGETVLHAAPMLSLEKCYNEPDLLKWSAKFEGPVIMSPKIDGLACSLRYNAEGHLYLAATRGDGAQGESITPNVAPMDSIPQSILV
jgi:DNA ligase (NAD+)